MDLQEYQRLKDRAESLRRRADQANGVVQQIESDLLVEYQCNSLEEGEVYLASLKKHGLKLSKELEEYIEKAQEQLDRLEEQ